MRCRTCQYALWNLRTRQCPECGTAFKPSEYEFVPHTIRFSCPHCGQGYFGTDEKGLLEPREFECAKCGSHVHLDETVLLPAEGVRERDTYYQRLPWTDTRQQSWVRRWLSTVWLALVHPHQMLDGPRRSGGVGAAWGFVALTAVIVSTAIQAPFFLIFGVVMLAFGGPPTGVMAMVVTFGALAAMGFAVTLVWAGLWALAAHGLLRITGGTPHGLGRTCEAICYSSGANTASAVPCFGYYFGWIWWVVSAVFMIQSAQRVSGARATLAGALFPVVMVVAAMLAYIGMMGWVMATAAFEAGVPVVQSTGATASRGLGRAALRYHAEHGEWPPHAAFLINDGLADPLAFIIRNSATQPHRVPVGDTVLMQLEVATVAEQAMAAREAADALPENVIAHRLGDFVLCWHGINHNLNASDAPLWLVIGLPDPDQRPPMQPGELIIVWDATGAIHHLPYGTFAADLAQQNALRAEHGLSPLPHPANILHGQAATTGD